MKYSRINVLIASIFAFGYKALDSPVLFAGMVMMCLLTILVGIDEATGKEV